MSTLSTGDILNDREDACAIFIYKSLNDSLLLNVSEKYILIKKVFN